MLRVKVFPCHRFVFAVLVSIGFCSEYDISDTDLILLPHFYRNTAKAVFKIITPSLKEQSSWSVSDEVQNEFSRREWLEDTCFSTERRQQDVSAF